MATHGLLRFLDPTEPGTVRSRVAEVKKIGWPRFFQLAI
jgi:hypothetical protein